VLAVSCDHLVWMDGRQQRADTAFAAVPTAAWQRRSAGEGSQGPRWDDWAWIPVAPVGATGMAHWAIARRSLSDPTELA
jgi:hypothetical protein